MKSNFMVKVEDARALDIQKALQQAGIKIKSVQEIYKEDDTSSQENK